MKRWMKNVAAVVFSAVICRAGTLCIAKAAEGKAVLKDGVLTLSGEVTNEIIWMPCYENQVDSIYADETVVFPENCDYLFHYLENVRAIDISNVDTSNVTSMSNMFSYCYDLETLTLGKEFITSSVTDTSYMFDSCHKLKFIDLSTMNTKNVTNMEQMFCGCVSLEPLVFGENFATDSATNFNCIFAGLNQRSFDLSFMNTENVTNMSGMFDNCGNLESITFGENFVTDSVTDMRMMFAYCHNLKSLDLSFMNTENVTDMEGMFDECYDLETLTLGDNFRTDKVESMFAMFRHLHTLKELDLCSFTLDSCESMEYMFYDSTSLEKIYISTEWQIPPDTVTREMFKGCTNLSGYKPDYIDGQCACAERGTGRFHPCYLSYGRSYVTDASITYDGTIGLYFWYKPGRASKIVMEGPNGTDEITASLLNSGRVQYKLYPTQINETVTVKFFDADGRQLDVYNKANHVHSDKKEVRYSVKEYLDNVELWCDSTSPHINEIVYAFKTYCYAIDNYFNGADHELEWSIDKTYNWIDYDGENIEYTPPERASYQKPSLSGTKMALVLASDPVVRIFCDGNETTAKLTYSNENGDNTVIKRIIINGDQKYFEFNAPIYDIFTRYKVMIGGSTLYFRPIDYGWLAYNRTDDKDLQILCDALYYFAAAALHTYESV